MIENNLIRIKRRDIEKVNAKYSYKFVRKDS
jgi:hypothetical protein